MISISFFCLICCQIAEGTNDEFLLKNLIETDFDFTSFTYSKALDTLESLGFKRHLIEGPWYKIMFGVLVYAWVNETPNELVLSFYDYGYYKKNKGYFEPSSGIKSEIKNILIKHYGFFHHEYFTMQEVTYIVPVWELGDRKIYYVEYMREGKGAFNLFVRYL